MVAGDLRREKCGATANSYRVPFWGDENILELVVIVTQPCEYILKTTELDTLER